MAEIDDATAELARFDVEMGTVPLPLNAILLRTESAASSQIENLTASAQSVAVAELGETSKPNAAEIVANVRAMRSAIESGATLDDRAVLRMHQVLMAGRHPAIAGRWRDESVWIGTSSISPIGAEYVAPHHARVPAAIADLMAYVNRADQPALAQAAVAHAQFETIHPFSDGNGRTGRALMHAMLRHHRVSRRVTVPVSAGLLHDVGAYHDALTAYRAGDPDMIVRQVADAALRAVNNGRRLAGDVVMIRERWREAVAA